MSRPSALRAPRLSHLAASTALAVTAAVLLLGPPPAAAQYFGRNQVLWEDFDFQTLETENFTLYYYPPDNPISGDLARMSERWYQRLGAAFGYRPQERTPVVFYADQPDFRQTTLSGGLIGEGVGGFTEPLRRRVVLPVAGTYAETDHVLGHELVHAFQFDLAAQLGEGGRATALGQVPLWMVEGLAEYFSVGREDPLTAMWLRDALARDALPDYGELNRGGRFNPYRFGQAFYAWIAGRWGDLAVSRFFVTSLAGDAGDGFEQVLGMDEEEAFEQWHAAIRDAYLPVLEGRRPPGERTRPLLTREATRGDINFAPSLSPDGSRIAFLSTRDLFTLDLFLADARTGEVIRRLASAAGNPHFDALRFLDSAGAWSPDGRRFAFVVYSEGDNELVVVDVDTGETVERHRPGIGALSNPAWSPDGSAIVFTGSASGLNDLYRLELATGEVRRLTDDPYAELHPEFSPDGSTLAFVTDRGPGTDLDLLALAPPGLALYDLATGEVRVLNVFPGARHVDPAFSPDGSWLYFVADPEGVSDLFRYRLADGRIESLTRLTTGVSGITALSPALSVAADSGEVAFSVYEEHRYEVHTLEPGAAAEPVAEDRRMARVAALLPPWPQEPGPGGAPETTVATYLQEPRAGLPPAGFAPPADDYRPDLGLTYLGPPTLAIGADRYGYGLAGSVTAVFSDPLDRHQVWGVFRGGASSEDFGALLGGQVGYLNRTNRLGWGGEVSRVPYLTARTFVQPTVIEVDGQPVAADLVQQVREQVTVSELSGVVEYPLSVNRRFEAGVGWSRYGFDSEIEELVVVGNTVIDRRESDLPSPEDLNLYRGSVAFVGDSSYFGLASPARGTRYRFEVGAHGGDLGYQSALADYRRYFFRRPLTLAVRGSHFGRYGDDAEDPRLNDLYVGRETLVRGYGIGDLDLSECTPVPGSNECPEFERLVGSRMAVINLELRLPLVGVEGYGLLELPWLPVELVLFADAGTAWTEDESPELRFDEDTAERVPVTSAGVALRMVPGGILPIELYYAHPFQRPDEDWQFGFVIAPGW